MASQRLSPSPNPYASGAVVFDLTPYQRVQERLNADRKAKAAALDKMYEDSLGNLKTDGLRQQDVEDFYTDVKGDREFWIKNKEAIRNPELDGGKKKIEFQNRLTERQLYIE